MNKHIKHIQNLLINPTYNSESEAKDYLESTINTGKLKPKYNILYSTGQSHFSSLAVTLPTDCIGEHEDEGMVVFGRVKEDYYEWVNFFLCVSKDGKEYVIGDFEDVVYASSKKFYDKFTEAFKVSVWDYQDI